MFSRVNNCRRAGGEARAGIHRQIDEEQSEKLICASCFTCLMCMARLRPFDRLACGVQSETLQWASFVSQNSSIVINLCVRSAPLVMFVIDRNSDRKRFLGQKFRFEIPLWGEIAGKSFGNYFKHSSRKNNFQVHVKTHFHFRSHWLVDNSIVHISTESHSSLHLHAQSDSRVERRVAIIIAFNGVILIHEAWYERLLTMQSIRFTIITLSLACKPHSRRRCSTEIAFHHTLITRPKTPYNDNGRARETFIVLIKNENEKSLDLICVVRCFCDN